MPPRYAIFTRDTINTLDNKSVFLIFNELGGTVHDTEKSPENDDDLLYYYPLPYPKSKYYLNVYRGESGWYILAGYGLAKKSVFEDY
jgi:hypothetical protein